jgi:hypothetical protein
MMKRLSIVVALLGALVGVAHAGAKYSYSVAVGTGWASGALGTARNSGDPNQVIGCQTYGTTTFLCYAHDPYGTQGSCVGSDANLLAWVRSLNGDSWLYFSWDTSGNCTFVSVENSSYLEPKQP